MGVSVPFSCSSRVISSMFCALCFGPMHLRIHVQLSCAQSSNSRRLDTSMSFSVKVAVHRSPMDIGGGSRSILFWTKQSISSMMTLCRCRLAFGHIINPHLQVTLAFWRILCKYFVTISLTCLRYLSYCELVVGIDIAFTTAGLSRYDLSNVRRPIVHPALHSYLRTSTFAGHLNCLLNLSDCFIT